MKTWDRRKKLARRRELFLQAGLMTPEEAHRHRWIEEFLEPHFHRLRRYNHDHETAEWLKTLRAR